MRHRQGRLRESAAEAIVAGEDAERAGYRPGLAHALYLRHINSVYLDEPDDALAEEALAIFIELGQPRRSGQRAQQPRHQRPLPRRLADALERYRASRAARERTGDLVGAATEDNNIGEILSDQGHYAEAERCFNAAKSSWRAASYPIGEALVPQTSGGWRLAPAGRSEAPPCWQKPEPPSKPFTPRSYVDETDLRMAECTLLAGELHRAAAAGAELTARFARPGGPRAALRHGPPAAGRRPGPTRRHRRRPMALLDESVTRLRTFAEGFELAQALAARAELTRRLGEGEASRGSTDEADARALFERLGVVSTPTW